MRFFIQYLNPLFSIHSPIPIRGIANRPNIRNIEKKMPIPCNIKYFFFRIRIKIVIGDVTSNKGKRGNKTIGVKKPIRMPLILSFLVPVDIDSWFSKFIKN